VVTDSEQTLHPSNVFSLENALDELYEVVFPPGSHKLHRSGRACKVILAPSLGALAGVDDRRRFLSTRHYYKLDTLDFFDFATSPLCSELKLADYEDRAIAVYESFDRTPTTPLLEIDGSRRGLSIADVAIARDKVFVSVTARLVNHKRSPNGKDWQIDEAWDQNRNWLMVTLVLAPDPDEVRNQSHLSLHKAAESAPLVEWGRSIIGPPLPNDPEWRFIQRGMYFDHLIDVADEEGTDAILTSKLVGQFKRDRDELDHMLVDETEIARLCFNLPAYCRFMYDLITSEKVSLNKVARPGVSTRNRQRQPTDEVTYRTIKSIRIIRDVASEGDTHAVTRSWTPPNYRYAVSGHWRYYRDTSVHGHDPFGGSIFGKTWVNDYFKGPKTNGEQRTRTAVPRTVIHVKQTLAYARALLIEHEADGGRMPVQRVSSRPTTKSKPSGKAAARPQPVERPPTEWRARERAKLTAALRFLIMRRDGFRCRLCGSSQADDNLIRLEVDHIVAVKDWGRTEESNLWTLCRNCNKGKSSRALH